MNARAAWIIVGKDWKLFVRDRTALLMSFALPLLLAVIFCAAMGGFGGGDSIGRIKLLVEDLDQSAASKQLVEQLTKTPSLRVQVQSGVRERVADGKAPAGLLIASGYGDDLGAGRKARIVLYRDPGKIAEQQIVIGSIMPVLFESAGPEIGRGMMRRGMSAMGLSAASIADAERSLVSDGDARPFDFAAQASDLLGLEIEDVAGGVDRSRKIATQAYALAGIAVMMLLFGLSACGGTLIEEKQGGTLQRLQLASPSGGTILLAKFVFALFVGLAQLVLLFALGSVVFDVPLFASPLALCVLSVATACAATGVGLLFAVTCRTRKQLEGLSTLVILGMSAIGGSWFPLSFTPEWYRTLGHFTLNAWAMDGFQAIFWYQKGIAGIALEVGVLLAIAAVTTLISMQLWKRRFEIRA